MRRYKLYKARVAGFGLILGTNTQGRVWLELWAARRVAKEITMRPSYAERVRKELLQLHRAARKSRLECEYS